MANATSRQKRVSAAKALQLILDASDSEDDVSNHDTSSDLSDDEFEPAKHVSETEDNVDAIEADSSTGDESQSDEEHEQVRFYKLCILCTIRYFDADFAKEINCFVITCHKFIQYSIGPK